MVWPVHVQHRLQQKQYKTNFICCTVLATPAIHIPKHRWKWWRRALPLEPAGVISTSDDSAVRSSAAASRQRALHYIDILSPQLGLQWTFYFFDSVTVLWHFHFTAEGCQHTHPDLSLIGKKWGLPARRMQFLHKTGGFLSEVPIPMVLF